MSTISLITFYLERAILDSCQYVILLWASWVTTTALASSIASRCYIPAHMMLETSLCLILLILSIKQQGMHLLLSKGLCFINTFLQYGVIYWHLLDWWRGLLCLTVHFNILDVYLSITQDLHWWWILFICPAHGHLIIQCHATLLISRDNSNLAVLFISWCH